MRKMTKLASLLAIAGMAFLSSCGGGEGTPPSVELDTTSKTVIPGEKVTVSVTVTEADNKLTSLAVTESSDMGGAATVDLDGTTTYTYEGTVPSDAAGSTITVTFTATDKKDATTTGTLTLTVETPLSNETTTSVVNNIQGPSTGAWDLVSDLPKTSSDSDVDKDIIDQTSAVTGEFLAGGWAAGNSTMFVVANDYDYANATVESAASAYAAGSASASLGNADLAVDNIIIAKLRGEENYSVLKITEVYDDGTDGGAGNNTDYRKFTYKK